MSPERTALLLGLLRMHLDATDAELAEIGANRADILDLIRQHDAQPEERASQHEFALSVLETAVRRRA
jgi:hypothetical protein